MTSVCKYKQQMLSRIFKIGKRSVCVLWFTSFWTGSTLFDESDRYLRYLGRCVVFCVALQFLHFLCSCLSALIIDPRLNNWRSKSARPLTRIWGKANCDWNRSGLAASKSAILVLLLVRVRVGQRHTIKPDYLCVTCHETDGEAVWIDWFENSIHPLNEA